MTIEIKDYKPINNSKCKGSFTLILHKTGFEFRNCTWFESEGKKWFSMPSKEYESEGKKKYYHFVALIKQEHREELNKSVLAALGLYFEKNPNHSPYMMQEPTIPDNSKVPF